VASNGTFWNHATVLAPRNGTTTHTASADGSGGSVVAGAPFTPTAGNLLVCVFAGAVTATTPAGWTLPTGGSAVNSTGMYVWWKIATGSDQIATTHNGSNYPVMLDFYEFKAGSVFAAATGTGAVTNGSAPDPVTGLSGTNWIGGAVCMDAASAGSPMSTTWASGVQAVDYHVPYVTTDGFEYSAVYSANDTATSKAIAATIANNYSASAQRLMYAVTVAA
jgi:hypothetical protein